MSYEEQAKRYGMTFEDFMEMVRENSEWWTEQVAEEKENE